MRLECRLERPLARLLGVSTLSLTSRQLQGGLEPALSCSLPAPVSQSVSVRVRVHSHAGIPLANARVHLSEGDRQFEVARPEMLAMEGYAHLAAADREVVENRVWARRAYATGSLE